MRSRNFFRTMVLLTGVVWVLGQPCSTVEAVPECRVIPISSDPPEESVVGADMTIALESARVTFEVECGGWGVDGLDSYCFRVGPVCPPPQCPCALLPQPPDDACSDAADCQIGDCVNGRCDAIALVAGHNNGVFDGQLAISTYNQTTDLFCASALEGSVVDDGNFHYFGTALMEVAYCPERSFDFTLEDAIFYLRDSLGVTTTVTPTVQTAHLEMLEPAAVASPSRRCGCGLFPLLFIPVVCGATLWQVRRTRKLIAQRDDVRS